VEKVFHKITIDTTLNILFENAQLTVTATNFKRSIDFKYLDSAVSNTIYIPRISVLALACRSTIFFVLLAGLSMIMISPNNWNGFIWISIFLWICAFASFNTIFGSYALGLMFGIKRGVWTSVIERYFSDYKYQVTIGNKNGNTILINAQINNVNKNKILLLQDNIEQIKTMVYNESLKPKIDILEKSHDYIKQLNSLNELLKSGILTQQEFDLKKKQIIGV